MNSFIRIYKTNLHKISVEDFNCYVMCMRHFENILTCIIMYLIFQLFITANKISLKIKNKSNIKLLLVFYLNFSFFNHMSIFKIKFICLNFVIETLA